jgi:poly-gamma-glutamate synthesis protein (capsule biosynthesis protein)
MNVTEAAIPFQHVDAELHVADAVFANLECCLHMPSRRSHAAEGFFADPQIGGEALRRSGIHAVGIANNVNYGAENIAASIARLDELGVLHTGAGANLAAARTPAMIVRNTLRVGALQRSSVYWPTDHEAAADSPGIAVIRGHTAYQVPAHKTRPEIPPMNRPGVPPIIVTWADKAYLAAFAEDIAALRARVDVVVASCHWGLGEEVLDYMTEIAHAAIDAGADIVIGHGPHYSLPVEVYHGKPIFYGLGSFSFHTGHGGRRHGDWIGMMAQVELAPRAVTRAGFRFVRHNDANETVFCAPADEAETLARLTDRASRTGTRLESLGDQVTIRLG